MPSSFCNDNPISETPLSPFEELALRNSDIPRQRIRDHVRALIISGRLTPGMLLPTTRRLAALWKVDSAAVHAGLTDLVNERLIIRRQGKGSFVSDHISQLHRVGLYANLESLSDPTKWFTRSVLVEIQRLLATRGIEAHAWMDPRGINERHLPWSDLEAAIRRKEMQGVILVDCTGATLKWAQSLPLPLSVLSTAQLGPFGVHKDIRGMMKLAMQSLAERGCKSAGLITVHPMSPNYETYYNDLVEMAALFDLRLKNSWIRIPDSGVVGFELARFGYQAFRELWSLPEHPDGLLIEPDIVAEGAVSAILELGVQVPSQLQLVLHRNENHEYICPFPTAQLLTSEKACAEALVTQIERQVNGQEVTPIYIPSHISNHPGEVGKTLPTSTFPFLLGHT